MLNHRYRVINSSLEDLEIVRRVQSGEVASYELLVLKYQPPIKQVVSNYLKNSHDVDDVVQEVFFNAYRALASFRCDSQFFTWLYRIAINASLKNLRKRSTTIALDLDINDDACFCKAEVLWDTCTPETQLQTDELSGIVRKSLASMPAEYRSVLLLCISGMSYKEIGKSLQIPIGTVRSRVHRAREHVHNDISLGHSQM